MQEIYHYSIIELFRKIGEELGYLPIKEYSLLNVTTERTEERVDLVWIKDKKVEYAFEFETINTKKSLNKLIRLSENIKKYIFFVNKSLNFESVNAIFIKDDDGLTFLYNLKKYGIKVSMHGEAVENDAMKELEALEKNMANNKRKAIKEKIEYIAENGVSDGTNQ